ncbi:MAG TPA: AraC family transcriptional regulator [Pseudogracilibacillus sp.]|nr:AraC family transcriptional regulator [Pseudogracilibacillus sp.]
MEQIVCEKRTYTDRKLTHAHDYVQLLFPLRGSLKLITATHEMRLTEEHAFCLPPHTEHTFYALDRNEFLVLDIPAEKLLPYDGKVIERHFPLDDKWLALRQLLLSEITAPNSDEFRLELLMDYTFASLLTEAKAYRSIAYIHRHYGRKINVHTLADLEGFHPTYYSIWFKQTFGMTPVQYIQRVRLEKAQQLLQTTNMSILAIALDVGFSHASSFNRLFKRQFACTPTQYRESVRGQSIGYNRKRNVSHNIAKS